ncbi:MAG: methylenetetrahydrofolate--tRNA-(uracil(54)-C(5))-methyltransferase (FADH(2)-oxidizing) TrmFO [Clostridiales bacterium]|nr:methylenetetrahydrofolate--tRNA-(uracil(54)-C(5))-methyltransferase (FADH(2)-oxidizing) TrmFO [Clostridiales bacterium]
MNDHVTVVGAGLAGSEAAWQLASRGLRVVLVEMKPMCFSPAHQSDGFAELVCSNSLKADYLSNASGLLKAEMRRFDSLILRAADASKLPAGGALAVDRNAFSAYITDTLCAHPLVEVVRERLDEIPAEPAIIATGPLTHERLSDSIKALPGFSQMHFFDAEAPIVTLDSLDMSKIFAASRYGKGDDDYLNCPMTETEYNAFYDALVSAQTAEVHDFDKDMVFEGCIAVEILAQRGRQTLAYGPMKPVGLTDPRTGKMPYAVVQLRRDNLSGSLYNLVGFQTRLKFGEQKRVFGMIPGLEHAEFARYGVMHKNTYLNSPDVLGVNYQVKGRPFLRFAGQMTGVEGYIESAASGLVAALGLRARLNGMPEPDFGDRTLLGALMRHTLTPVRDFQPMNANFGLLPPLDKKIRNKKERYELVSQRALDEIDRLKKQYSL